MSTEENAMSQPIKPSAPNAGKRKRPSAPEEILIDLFWARYWTSDRTRLLVLAADGSLVMWRDNSDWPSDEWKPSEEFPGCHVLKETAPLPPADWKPPEEAVAFLKDRMAEGYIPVGVISPGYDHPNRTRRYPCGQGCRKRNSRIMLA
jgi:hypothetical protein